LLIRRPLAHRVSRDYTVEVTFNTPRFLTAPVASPRSNVYASYSIPKQRGPYPVSSSLIAVSSNRVALELTSTRPFDSQGQSFSACSYTSCPLGNDPSEDKVFTFPFQGFPQVRRSPLSRRFVALLTLPFSLLISVFLSNLVPRQNHVQRHLLYLSSLRLLCRYPSRVESPLRTFPPSTRRRFLVIRTTANSTS